MDVESPPVDRKRKQEAEGGDAGEVGQRAKVDDAAEDDDNGSTAEGSLKQEGEDPPGGLSKNALKRLRRAEYLAKKWEEKKKAKREQVQAKKEAREAACPKEEGPQLSEEEVQRRKEERARKREESRLAFLASCEKAPRVAIDCEWTPQLTEKERKSLVSQVMYCHASNKKTDQPFYIHLTSASASFQEVMSKSHSGLDQWPGFFMDNRSYLDVWGEEARGRLVYLTSDSENVLTELDSDKIYIIGGIVDRNRLKGATFRKAQEQGIATAKLPLDGLVKLDSSRVLTVNHVFDIMLHFRLGHDWSEAFLKVLPLRKKPELKEGGKEEGAKEEGSKEGGSKGEGAEEGGAREEGAGQATDGHPPQATST